MVDSLETRVVQAHLAALFTQYGKPDRRVTDNAPTFRSAWDTEHHRFSDWLATHGVVHQRISPYYPEANGKAEAMVKIAKREAIQPFLERLTWTGEELQRCFELKNARRNVLK